MLEASGRVPLSDGLPTGMSPRHSIKQPVHQDNTECNTGNNIERENLRQGTGGKPLCKECGGLDKEGN